MSTIVTGWSPKGWTEYGRRFAESFARHWPAGVSLFAYVEAPVDAPRVQCRDVLEIPGCRHFIERHGSDAFATGRKVAPTWKAGAVKAGYNWRHDAVKFCRQGFIPADAARKLPEGALFAWLDADVVTFSDVPAGFPFNLLPPGFDLAYLGRGAKHSEIGFQLYRNTGAARWMLEEFAALYATDRIFAEREQHSAFAFDLARRRAAERVGLKAHDLTPGGRGHVWFDSPLGSCLDHLKGDRKAAGQSPERKTWKR